MPENMFISPNLDIFRLRTIKLYLAGTNYDDKLGII